MTHLYDEKSSPLFSPKAARAASFGLAAIIETAGQHLVQPLLAWRRKQTTYRELMALDDHQLADIGLNRDDIRRDPVSYSRLIARLAV